MQAKRLIRNAAIAALALACGCSSGESEDPFAAADRGDAEAQHRLGDRHYSGLGAPQDYRAALKWYRLAAEQGHAAAQRNLGGMYAQGEGVPQDYREAAKWYRAAAEQGDTNAQYFLGEMYANGRGVSRDRREAMKWLDMAGNAPVGTMRSRLDDADEGAHRNSVQPGR